MNDDNPSSPLQAHICIWRSFTKEDKNHPWKEHNKGKEQSKEKGSHGKWFSEKVSNWVCPISKNNMFIKIMIKKQSCGWLSCKQFCVVLASDNATSLCLDYSICLWLVRAPFLQNSALARHEKKRPDLTKIHMMIDAYTCLHSRLKSWSLPLTVTKQN